MDPLEVHRSVGNAAEVIWAYRDFLIKAKLFGPDVVAIEDALLQLEQSLAELSTKLAEKSPPES